MLLGNEIAWRSVPAQRIMGDGVFVPVAILRVVVSELPKFAPDEFRLVAALLFPEDAGW